MKFEKIKIKMDEIDGLIELNMEDFPEWNDYPDVGEGTYTDSRVFEIELKDKMFNYFIKVYINIKYKRWYRPQTDTGPEEDTISDYEFSAEAVSGTREYLGESMVLSAIELEQFDTILKDKITFI